MASDTAIRHPSPHRERTEGWIVAFGLLAAPTAWALAHLVTYSVASVVCFPGRQPRPADGFGWLPPVLLIVYVIGIVIAAAAVIAAWRAWRTSREEAHGHAEHAAEIGEGRTRFMALWGMLTSGTFLFLMAFDAISSLMVPPCMH